MFINFKHQFCPFMPVETYRFNDSYANFEKDSPA